MKILYIEDNEDNILILKRRLGRLGFDVACATDGAQGIAMAAELKPDVILMDLSLPALDGWEATRRLKAAPETNAIPIIALTSHAMVGEEEKALAAGCDDFDTKPVELQRLLAKIRALAVAVLALLAAACTIGVGVTNSPAIPECIKGSATKPCP